jgi:hypothetical protein
MGKKIFRLTETELRGLIRESVNRVLNEGTTDQAMFNSWDTIKGQMGAEAMLDAIYNYMNTDEIAEIIRLLKRDYDVNDVEDADYEEVEGDDPSWEWADYEEIK